MGVGMGRYGIANLLPFNYLYHQKEHNIFFMLINLYA